MKSQPPRPYMARIWPVLLIVLWLGLVSSTEAKEAASLDKQSDQAIISAALALSRQELSAPRQWVHEAVGRADAVNSGVHALASKESSGDDSAPAIAQRYLEEDKALARKAVRTSDALTKKKKSRKAKLLAEKQERAAERTQKRTVQTDRLIRAAQQQRPVQAAHMLESKWLDPKLKYTDLTGFARRQDRQIMSKAKAALSQVEGAAKLTQQRTKEKISKATAKKKRDNRVLGQAVKSMSHEIEAEKQLVNQAVHQTAGEDAKALAKSGEKAEELAIKSAKEDRGIQSAAIAQKLYKPEQELIYTNSDKLVDQASARHDAKLKWLRAQQLAKIERAKQELLQKREEKQNVMPEALGEMNKVLKDSQKHEQEALEKAAVQLDGEEARKVQEEVQTRDKKWSTGAVTREAKQQEGHVMQDALRVEQHMMAKTSGLQHKVKQIVDQAGAQKREKDVKHQKMVAAQMHQREKLHAEHQEVAHKAIAAVKTGRAEGMHRSEQMRDDELKHEAETEESVLHGATTSNLKVAVKTAQQALKGSSELRREAVAHAKKMNLGIGHRAKEAEAEYQKHHKASQEHTNKMVQKVAKQRELKKAAALRAKLKAKAAKAAKKDIIMPKALKTMATVTKETHGLVKQGLHHFTEHPQEMNEAHTKAAAKRRASERLHKSDKYVLHKAHNAQKKVEATMAALKSQTAEMVQKAPAIAAANKKRRADEKQNKSNEKSQKAEASIAKAKRHNQEVRERSTRAEKEYLAQDRAWDDAVAKRIDAINADTPLQRAVKVQKLYAKEHKSTLKKLNQEVAAQEQDVQLANRVEAQFQLGQPRGNEPSWSDGKAQSEANRYLKGDGKFQRSRDTQYESLMNVLSNP